MAPAELMASKIISYHQRRGQPKSGTGLLPSALSVSPLTHYTHAPDDPNFTIWALFQTEPDRL